MMHNDTRHHARTIHAEKSDTGEILITLTSSTGGYTVVLSLDSARDLGRELVELSQSLRSK